MKIKRKLTFVMAFAMCCGLAINPTVTEAETIDSSIGNSESSNGTVIESGVCGDNSNYTVLYDGNIVTISINGTGEITDFKFGDEAEKVFEDSIDNYNENVTVSLEIGEGITSIGDYAFNGLLNRDIELSLPNTLESIGDFAFENDYIKTIYIPDSVTYISPTAFISSAKDFVVDENNTSYTDVNGVLFTKDMKTLIQYPALRSNDELNGYIVPETVTKLYSSSFFMRDVISNTNDVSITIPCDADVEIVTEYYQYFGHTRNGIIESCNYDSFTIYGYEGSGIEEYVNTTNAQIQADDYYFNDINFVAIERPTTDTTQKDNNSNSNTNTNKDNNSSNSKNSSSPNTADKGIMIPSILTLMAGLTMIFTKKVK